MDRSVTPSPQPSPLRGEGAHRVRGPLVASRGKNASEKADSAKTFAANRAVGKIALAVRATAGITRRARVHEQGSLRVRCPGPPAQELEAVIVNTAGGMAGGDRFAVDIAVAPGARLIVTTAAAEKVYRTLEPDTAVEIKLAVAAGASLAWLPQETILFDRARLKRTIEVELAEDARLILAEAIVFGRSGMGETVEDGALFDRWRVHRAGRLLHAEAVRLDGAIMAKLAEPAVAKGGVAAATVLVVPADDGVVDAVLGLGETFRGEVGASAWNGLAVVRLCAADGAALRHDLIAVLASIRGAALPRLWRN
jgi:urease accessory protein